MTRVKRALLWIFVPVIALLLITLGALVITIQSSWFKNKVRERIVAIVEEATGGRAEIGKFNYDWRNLTVEVEPFVLHGKETAGASPLFRAEKIQIGLRIISALKKDVDIARLSVDRPQVNITVAPDGTTNLPTPKLIRSNATVIQQLLDLKVRQFALNDGYANYNELRVPLDLQAEKVKADLRYDPGGPRYTGEISSRQVRAASARIKAPVAFDLDAKLSLEKEAIRISSARLCTNQSTVELAGAVQDLPSPRGDFDLTAHLLSKDLSRPLSLPLSDHAAVDFNGKASFSAQPFLYNLTGRIKGRGIDYASNALRITGLGLASDIEISPTRISLPNADISALKGRFRGAITIQDLKRFAIKGEARDFPIQELARVSGQRAEELNGAVTGPILAEGLLTKSGVSDLKVQAKLEIMPAASGIPLRGLVAVGYDQRAGKIDLAQSDLTIGSSELHASGVLGESLKVQVISRNLDDLVAALPAVGRQPPKDLPLKLKSGMARFDGSISGPLNDPHIAGQLELTHFAYENRDFDHLQTNLDLTKSNVEFRSLALDQGSLHVQGSGRSGLIDWMPGENSPIAAVLTVRGADLAKLNAESGNTRKIPISGNASAAVNLKGTWGNPQGTVLLQAANVVFYDEKIATMRADIVSSDHTLDLVNSDIAAFGGRINATGSFSRSPGDWTSGQLRFNISANGLNLSQTKHLQDAYQNLMGQFDGTANGTGKLAKGEFELTGLSSQGSVHNIVLDSRPYGQVTFTASAKESVLSAKISADLRGAPIEGSGEWRLTGDYPGQAQFEIPRLTVATMHDLAPGQHVREQLPFEGFIQGSIKIAGPLKKPELMKANIVLNRAQINANPSTQPLAGAQARDLVLYNSKPIVLEATTKAIDVRNAEFVAKDTTLDINGRFTFDSKSPWDLSLNGNVNLTILQIFNPDLLGSGNSIIKATLRGPFSEPQVDGRLELKNASLFLKDVPNGVDQANGVILFDRNRATVESLTALTGGGQIKFLPGSFVGFRGFALVYRLQAEANGVRYRSADGVSITVSAALNLVGTSDNSVLSGTVTVERAGFNPRTDVGGLLASTAKPTSATGAPSEYLKGIQFDVRVVSSQTLAVQTSLTRDVQAEANLRIRGTTEKPVVLGNITVSSGEIEFFGNKYRISHGEINFFNPAKIDPILNMDLETRVRGITVDITFAGALNKLSFSYRSDPPLETNQIVALLAVGRVPTNTGGLASSQTTTNSSYLATGSNALLSQAITPASGRLQRFFGVSHIKIDPQFTDITTIPQARLTLEQQISKDVTLTYITNLTRTQEQIVRVEWDLSRQWSVIALRDENGAFGIDFQYRKRFK